MPELPKYISNYLRKFGMDRWKLELSKPKYFNVIVVVPAIEECQNIPKLLESLTNCEKADNEKTLFIFVINNLSSSSLDVKEDNQKTLEYLRGIISGISSDELARKINSSINIGVVDASSNGFELPEKDGGVGYARKIGMDLALQYFDYSQTAPKNLVCLDADCTVSKNYLVELEKLKQQAGYFEYEHTLPNDDLEKDAIITYEIFLRYYVLALQFAKSPYALDTIGSTMFCDVESYIKIGGMNKKKAAEDFYFLEKLAKVVKVEKNTSAKIFPSSRKSWRVPFGTGQRVNRFFAGTHDENSLYHPKCFEVLKDWIELFYANEILETNEYLSRAKEIDETLYKFLLEQNFEKAWDKIINETQKKDQLQKQKYFWFDGFKTLKLIHYLRDNKYQQVNMFEALDWLLNVHEEKNWLTNKNDSWRTKYEYLKILRSISIRNTA